jgi:hypothetical protein
MSLRFCPDCHGRINVDHAVGVDGEYTGLSCPSISCTYRGWQCCYCLSLLSRNRNRTQTIKKHLSSCKSRVPAGDSDQQIVVNSLVIDDPHVDPELESISSMIYGEAADIDLFSTNLADYLTLDSGDDYRIPASCKTIIDGHAYPNFGDERNDAFFGQEQQLFNCNGQHGGGCVG